MLAPWVKCIIPRYLYSLNGVLLRSSQASKAWAGRSCHQLQQHRRVWSQPPLLYLRHPGAFILSTSLTTQQSTKPTDPSSLAIYSLSPISPTSTPTHSQQPTRIEMTDYASLKVPDLKKLLQERGLQQSGNKADLIARLQDNDKSRPNSNT